MKIKTLLLLSTAALILFTGVVSSLVHASSLKTGRMAAQGAQAEDLVAQVFELNALAQDYVMYHEARPRTQWYVQYALVQSTLSSPVLDDEPSRSFLPKLRTDMEGIKLFFEDLTAQADAPDSNPALERQIASDLLVKTRTMISDARDLAETAFKERTRSRASTDRVIYLLLGVLAVVACATIYVLHRRILVPLLKLQKGTSIVGKGNLEFRVGIGAKNEVGDLARAFDEMTVKLKRSHEGLEEKVKERTRELEDLSSRNAILLESIGDGVFAMDRYWNIILWNAAAARITGWSEHEAVGKPFREVIRFVRANDKSENIGFIEQAMLMGETRSMENDTLLIAKDGREVPVGDSAAPIHEPKTGAVVGAIVVFRDVSTEKQLKEKEHQMAKLKDDFLFRTIHDLRSPTSIISLALAMHEEEEARFGPHPELEKGIAMIKDASSRMSRLIEDLLDIAKGEKAEIDLKKEPIDLADIVGKVLEQLTPGMTPRGIKGVFVPLKEKPVVLGDADALKEVFDNLINNAVKYNKDGGTITVTQEIDGTMIKTAVQDTGLGIPAESMSKLFTPYFRAADKAIQGTGLGLYIVKNFVEKMGGEVKVTSTMGQGSRFTVSLPRVKS